MFPVVSFNMGIPSYRHRGSVLRLERASRRKHVHALHSSNPSVVGLDCRASLLLSPGATILPVIEPLHDAACLVSLISPALDPWRWGVFPVEIEVLEPVVSPGELFWQQYW